VPCRPLLLAGALALATGCAEPPDNGADFKYVYATVIQPRCATEGCHSAASAYTLTNTGPIDFSSAVTAYSELTGVDCGAPAGIVCDYPGLHDPCTPTDPNACNFGEECIDPGTTLAQDPNDTTDTCPAVGETCVASQMQAKGCICIDQGTDCEQVPHPAGFLCPDVNGAPDRSTLTQLLDGTYPATHLSPLLHVQVGNIGCGADDPSCVGYTQMPADFPLTISEIHVIENWIKAGAPCTP